jgi:hypothetical protein
VSFGWQYILQHFREEVRNVTDQANNFIARASIVASNVQGDVAEAARYELDALSSGGQARRDARRANGIKASDFFSKCDEAWTAIERAADATAAAYNHSNTAISEAVNARNSQTHNSSNYNAAQNYVNYTQTAANQLDIAQNKAEVARDTITRFSTATKHDQDGRNQERQNAERAVRAAQKIIDKNAGLSAASTKLAVWAQEVRHTASMAVAAVEQGRMEIGKEHLEKAKKDLDKIDQEAQRIAAVKNEVRKLYIDQALG